MLCNTTLWVLYMVNIDLMPKTSDQYFLYKFNFYVISITREDMHVNEHIKLLLRDTN